MTSLMRALRVGVIKSKIEIVTCEIDQKGSPYFESPSFLSSSTRVSFVRGNWFKASLEDSVHIR